MAATKLPYAQSTSGQAREGAIRDTLRGAGATAIGFMADDDRDMVICQFRLDGREITVPVSVGQYEAAWKKLNPRGTRTSQANWSQRARDQAELAVWAVLADWIKAQTAMMICGFFDTDTAFLSHIATPSGQRVIEVVRQSGTLKALPKPDDKP